MLLTLTQRLLPRASCRCFTSRVPASGYSVKDPLYSKPRTGSAYNDLQIPNPDGNSTRSDTEGTWDNQVADHIVGSNHESAADRWRQMSRNLVPNLQRRPPADAYTGRSVRVKGTNFSEAVRNFEKILSYNQVRRTVFATERHEKKGVKRRRIKSQQWRKHFAQQVRNNVKLVHKIRRRGA
ncbi:hypothetical protein DFH07DRAFT_106957 [Mycena maculata]|uniref:Uncharacterized protein n=1 Tax=Mycena maculata TaxID=230809 RepID=A0AAD7K2S7_9AGAR|nr:hypothetical protein DFH07DRAFT_106957 [Mycena maculata]